MKNLAKCEDCKEDFPLKELDSQDDGTGNFTILKCKDCYGDGYSEM